MNKLEINCYKHDGTINKKWDEAIILEEYDDYIVCGNYKTLVTRQSGKKWRTREPAIMYFFKEEWFNIIVQFKDTGITYYCNIASPYIIEDNTIKYIDYELDLRIFANKKFKILDRNQFNHNKEKYKYSKELIHIIEEALNKAIINYKANYFYFNDAKNKEKLKKLEKVLKSIDREMYV